jgi:methionyl-tRNA formyltransferase
MRIAIIGQQDFGKAALEAFLNRGDEVAAVFCAPEKGRPDPLRLEAETRGVTVHQFPKLTDPAAQEALKAAQVQIGVMAYVTQFVPQDFCNIPQFGTIQFHPSLLPLHRGASSMSWSIILGRKETGFSIFRPTDGLDEGPVVLTRSVPIEDEDTLGSLYFGKIFPMGVAGLVEVADLVVAGNTSRTRGMRALSATPSRRSIGPATWTRRSISSAAATPRRGPGPPMTAKNCSCSKPPSGSPAPSPRSKARSWAR